MGAPASGRVDAQRNHERIVAAAGELFAEEGIDVSVRDVAGRAGVGVGTLYRHFPTREDLIDAVLVDAFAQLVAVAESALAEPDPWHGFARFVEEALALHGRNRGLKDVETGTRGRERATAMRERLWPLIGQLVRRAHEQGTLRKDFTPQDVPLLFWGSDRVLELVDHVAPELWRRHLAFVLDGLRAPAATPLPQPPLTERQLERVGSRRRTR